jgi:hypothetical protein
MKHETEIRRRLVHRLLKETYALDGLGAFDRSKSERKIRRTTDLVSFTETQERALTYGEIDVSDFVSSEGVRDRA